MGGEFTTRSKWIRPENSSELLTIPNRTRGADEKMGRKFGAAIQVHLGGLSGVPVPRSGGLLADLGVVGAFLSEVPWDVTTE